MYTINEEIIYEQIIKKSLFICRLYPVNSLIDALGYLDKIKKENMDATHNCYAYIIGSSIFKSSDDGEPSGTAGLPIFEVLNKNHLTNIICIVTRFFGGIKLGAGGLVRAYANSTSGAIKKANLIEIINYKIMSIEFSYEYTNIINSYLNNFSMLDKAFTDKVSLIYKIPEDQIDEITLYLINITKNNIKIEVS